jgi:hypothetical protein
VNDPRVSRLAPLLLLCLGLSACGDYGPRQFFGLDKNPPDAFAVVSRAPLTLPPDFGLRPPKLGQARPNETPVSAQARTTVFGLDTGGLSGEKAAQIDRLSSERSPGEAQLLKMAGAVGVDPTIRETINTESEKVARESRNIVEQMVVWKAYDPAGVPVDAAGEQKRLQENAALGRPVTDGDTPVVVRRNKSIWQTLGVDKIF